MGTWGTGIFDNDAALDIKDEYEEKKDVELLQNKISLFTESLDSGPDADDCAEALAAIDLLLESDGKLEPQVLQNIAQSIQYILDKSELKELWQEGDEFEKWAKSISEVTTKLADKISTL